METLSIGEHFVQIRAGDLGDNIDPSPATYTWTVVPPLDCDAANITLTATADGYVDEMTLFDNMVLIQQLAVRSGDLAANARALFRFPLANTAPGCVLGSATLRLYSGSSTDGRTLQALPIAEAWTELLAASTRRRPGTSPPAPVR